jgi:HK97 family phage prohead protease
MPGTDTTAHTYAGIEIRRLGATGLDVEARAGGRGGDLPAIVGYAAVFDTPTEIQSFFGSFTEIIRAGAFAKTIVQDDIRALFNHDPNLVLGRSVPGAERRATLTLAEDRHGLHMEITPPDTQLGRDVVEMVRRGDVTGASFGFTTTPKGQRWTHDENGDPVQREILEARLYDVSPVTFPAYDETEVSSRAAAWARRGLALGLEGLTEEEVALVRRLLHGHPAPTRSAGPNGSEDTPLARMRRQLAAIEAHQAAGTEEG